jgi:hypothetical protein
MAKINPILLATAMIVVSSAVISASANDTNIFQRGSHTEAVVETWGPNRTSITQMGSHGRVRLKVRGAGNETHVFTGICPPGSTGRAYDIRSDDTLNLIVVPCR